MEDTKNKTENSVEANKPNENKLLPRKKGKGNKQVYEPKTLEAMYRLYFIGTPLTDIAKEFGVQVNDVFYLKERNKWSTRRQRTLRKLEAKTDEEMLNLSWRNEHDRAKFIEKIYRAFKLRHDAALDQLYKNLDNPKYQADFADIRETKQLLELLHNELNGGVKKTEQVLSGSVTFEQPRRIYTDAEKREALKLVVGGKGKK